MEETGDDDQEEEELPEAASGGANTPPEAIEKKDEVESPSRSPRGMAINQTWRSMLLDQATRRDEKNQGLLALYEQYSKCQRSLQAHYDLKSGSSRVGPAIEAKTPEPSEANAQEMLRNTEKLMRQKDAELLALQRQNKELQEELHEKELAHAHTGREATRLSQENGRLKAELERMRESMSRADAQPAATGGAGANSTRSPTERSICMAPVELPQTPKVVCNLQTELTCVSAGLQNGDALPRTLVAVGTNDGYVKLVDGLTGRLEAHLSVARQLPKVIDLQLTEAGLLLVASSDQAVRLLDLQRRRLVHTLRGHRGLVSACGWLQGSRAFTAGADRTVKLWDVEKGQVLRSMPCAGPVTTARAHRQSGVVVAGYADGRLSVFDPRLPEAPAEPVRLHQSAQAVVGVQLSHDGNLVLSQAQDGSVCCTALGCPEPTLRLQASGPLDSGPSPPAFSPDGASILARGAASVHCWTKDGHLVYNHDLQPAVAVSWDLQRAVSIHRSGHFYSWGADQEGADDLNAGPRSEPQD